MKSLLIFVVAVNFLYEATAHVIAKPIIWLKRRLPNTSGPSFPRLAGLKAGILRVGGRYKPDWIEHSGSLFFKLKTTRGSTYLDRLVERIPDRALNCWIRGSVAAMVAMLAVWAAILLTSLVILLGLLGKGAIAVMQWLGTVDWISLFTVQPAEPVQIDIAAQLMAVAAGLPDLLLSLAIAFLWSLAMFWGVMLLFLPGISLHEFGHYAALKKHGLDVEHYGLFTIGPYPGGAFVEPACDLRKESSPTNYAVLAAGIGNTLLWAAVLLITGLFVTGSPVAAVVAALAGDISLFVASPAAGLLVLLAVFEAVNAFLNAFPRGPVDGGLFVEAAEREFYGIERKPEFSDRLQYVSMRLQWSSVGGIES